MLLAVAVNSPVALFESIRVERQFQVDEIVAALVQVQAFRGSVRADEDQALLCAKPLRSLAPVRILVVAAYRHHFADVLGAEVLGDGVQAVHVLGVNEDARRRIFLADRLDQAQEFLKLGVLIRGLIG